MKKVYIILTAVFLLVIGNISFGKEKFSIHQGEEDLQLDYFPKAVVTDSAIISRFLAALDIDLVGVASSTTKIPEKYDEVPRIG